MFKLLWGALLGLRKVFLAIFQRVFNNFRDEETGKLKGLSPENWKRLALTIGLVFFATIILINIFTKENNITGGAEDFRKELTPKLGIKDSSKDYRAIFEEGNPLGNLDKLKNTDDLTLKRSGTVDEFEQLAGLPNISRCLDLFEKLKSGAVLTPDEKVVVDICIQNDIAKITAEEAAALRQLLRDDLTLAERDAIRKFLNRELDESSPEFQAIEALMAAQKSGDQDSINAAQAALRAALEKDLEAAQALIKQALGQRLTDPEMAAARRFSTAEMNASNQGSSSLDNPMEALDKTEALKNLLQDIADRENAIQDLDRQIEDAQALAAVAGEKISKGIALTKEEEEALKRLTDLQKQRSDLQAIQDQRKKTLAELMKLLQDSLSAAASALKEVYPSGISVELDEDFCKDVKSLITVKKPKPRVRRKAVPKEEVWLAADGSKLTPDKIKMVQLYRKQKAEEERERLAMNNKIPDDSLGERLDINQALGDDQGELEIGKLFVYSNDNLKPFNLTPDMKIAAVLDSDILVSDKGQGQSVRVRIIEDIRDPATNRLVIPKGSIAIAQAQGFDADTGVINLNFSTVVVGSGKAYPVNLSIGSADGTMGLKGEVRDTRGKFLLGAFITSFTSGALNWFSQQIIQDFITSTQAGNAITGAALQGGSDVANRIAELYAGDLQNAAKIYYAPKNIPVILFPQM